MRLFLLTAVALNLRFLLATPMFERRSVEFPSQEPVSGEQPSVGNNVVPIIGGLAAGGTVGYFVGQQSERIRNNRQRQPPSSPTSQAKVDAPNIRTSAEIEEERVSWRMREKMAKLQAKIYTALQSDPYGFEWVYECKRIRSPSTGEEGEPGIGWDEDRRITLEECFEEYLRLKRDAKGQQVPPYTEEESDQKGNNLNEFRNVDLKSEKTAKSQPKQSFRNFMPSIDVGKLNRNAAGASALRQLQSAPKFAPEGTSPMLPRV